MRISLRLLIATALFTSFICVSALHAAKDQLLFYKVEHDNSQLYLLGSMHLVRENVYPLRNDIMQAFDSADSLVVEVDIREDASARIRALMLSEGMYPEGESIRDHLTQNTWKRLEKLIRQYALPSEVFAQFRPGFLVTTLSSMEMMRLGMRPELGIDLFFLQAAGEKKNIVELETALDQVMLLQNFPDAELVVTETLESIDDMDLLLDEMIAAWKTGDAKGLKKIVLDDPLDEYPEYAQLYEKIFDDRNRKMTQKLEHFLSKPERTFVVVGAGHLVGDEGIVNLLRKRGFNVKQL